MDPNVWIFALGTVLVGLIYVKRIFYLTGPTRVTVPVISEEESEERANQLLRETLSLSLGEYESLVRGYMIIVPSRLPYYCYELNIKGEVTLFTEHGIRISLCVRPWDRLPKDDRVLTMIRHLQANEIGLIKKAGFGNRVDLRKALLKELNRTQRPS